MRRLYDLIHALHRKAGYPARLKQLVELVPLESLHPRRHFALYLIQALPASTKFGILFFLGPLRAAHQRLERLPPVVHEESRGRVTVLALPYPREHILLPRFRHLRYVVGEHGEVAAYVTAHRVHRRHVNFLPQPVLLPVEQRAHRTRRRDPARKVHGLVSSGPQRTLALRVRHVHCRTLPAHAAHVPCDQVSTLPIPVWARVSERSYIRPDQTGVEFAQRVRIYSQFPCLSRLNVCNEDVGAGYQLVQASSVAIAEEV